MTFLSKNLVKSGEDLARRFLVKKGFKILGTNVFYPVGEIDILAQDKKDLVIVEVKTKSSEEFGLPQEMVHLHKQKKLRQLAKTLAVKYPNETIRIDVVAVSFFAEEVKIEYIRNAVEE